jgi:hypothetical protein
MYHIKPHGHSTSKCRRPDLDSAPVLGVDCIQNLIDISKFVRFVLFLFIASSPDVIEGITHQFGEHEVWGMENLAIHFVILTGDYAGR